jgi:hypothetical protein
MRAEHVHRRERVCDREIRRERLAGEDRLALDVGVLSGVVEDGNIELAAVESAKLLDGAIVQDPCREMRFSQPQSAEKREQPLDWKVWVTPDAQHH